MKRILWNLSSNKKSNIDTMNIIHNTKDVYRHYVLVYNINDTNIINVTEEDLYNLDLDVIINSDITDVISCDYAKVISRFEFQDVNLDNIELVKDNIDSSNIILTNSNNINNISNVFQIDKKIDILKNPIDLDFINEHKIINTSPRILYTHSINKNEYHKNAFKKFIDVIRHLNERIAFDVEVIFVNDEELDFDLKNVFGNLSSININIVSPKYYDEYIEELWKGEIVVATFDDTYECEVTSEIIDSIFTNNAILIPNYGPYKDIVSDNFKWTHNGTIQDISNKLLGLITNISAIEQNCTGCKSFYLNNFSNKINIEKFHSIIKEVDNK